MGKNMFVLTESTTGDLQNFKHTGIPKGICWGSRMWGIWPKVVLWSAILSSPSDGLGTMGLVEALSLEKSCKNAHILGRGVMLTHWRVLTAQFRYIYAYAWREWNEAARELGRLVSPHRCLRTLGTHRAGGKGRVNCGDGPASAQRGG